MSSDDSASESDWGTLFGVEKFRMKAFAVEEKLAKSGATERGNADGAPWRPGGVAVNDVVRSGMSVDCTHDGVAAVRGT